MVVAPFTNIAARQSARLFLVSLPHLAPIIGRIGDANARAFGFVCAVPESGNPILQNCKTELMARMIKVRIYNLFFCVPRKVSGELSNLGFGFFLATHLINCRSIVVLKFF